MREEQAQVQNEERRRSGKREREGATRRTDRKTKPFYDEQSVAAPLLSNAVARPS